MDQNKKSLLAAHLATLLFGISGIFGKLLALPSLIITLGRVFFSSLALFFILLMAHKPIRLQNRRDFWSLAALGVLLAAHWASFYEAIQLSTVALGLLSFSTFPVFATFLEPLFFHQKLRLESVIVALVVFLGVAIVVPEFRLENQSTKGILFGVFSGLTYALLSLMNKKFSRKYSGAQIGFYEQFFAFLCLLPTLLFYRPHFTIQDLALLALLGILFTGLAHALFISSLRNISVQTAGVLSCLEPIYSTLFAFLFLGEAPAVRDYIGGAIILGAAIYSTLRAGRSTKTPSVPSVFSDQKEPLGSAQ